MMRAAVTATAADVVLDIKPDGGIEFMRRATDGGPTKFIAGGYLAERRSMLLPSRYFISRVHCAVSVNCWNITTLPSRKRYT